MSTEKNTVRLKVSPEAARLLGKGVPRDAQMQAARGTLDLNPRDTGDVLFFLAHSPDPEIKKTAIGTVKSMAPERIVAILDVPERPPQFLEMVARCHLGTKEVAAALLANEDLPSSVLTVLAGEGGADVLDLLMRHEALLAGNPELCELIRKNPQAGFKINSRLDVLAHEQTDSFPEDGNDNVEASPGESGEEPEDDEALSKYQKALEMGVSDKIKMALTGDKEWRGIFIKDANKLVSSAVMKNPRITDGEVLAIAKNKSSSDELIRLITLNREWVKNYEIKKALIDHPRTPLPTALRYMNVLTEKDIKTLAKSRGVSQVIVNNARRMLIAKEKK